MTRWLLLTAALLLGCGGSDDDSTTDAGAGNGNGNGNGNGPPAGAGATPEGEQIDCTFFERPDGCWARVIESIRACRPSPVDGEPIDDQPDAFGDYVYRFTMTDADGVECLRYDDEEEPLVLHLREGDLTYTYGNLLDPANAFGQLTCPDGSAYWMPYAEFSKCAPKAGGASQGSYHLHGLTLGFNDDQLTSWICYAPPH